jgi:hypothetical protein
MMMGTPDFNKEDLDNLSDIAWYILGVLDVCRANDVKTYFHKDHIDTIEKARKLIAMQIKKQGGEG